MAVPRELKLYIERKFAERIKAVEGLIAKEKVSIFEQHREESFTLMYAATSDILDNLMGQLSQLEKQGFTLTYDGRELLKNGVQELVNIPSIEKANKTTEDYEKQIVKLKSEQELLLITISLEKNFDKINALLASHNMSL